jgi:hypothetical protein
MNGPSVKPSPKALPMTMPMPRARSSGGVMSAMYACATARFAVAMPLKTRAASSIGSVVAAPSNAIPAAVAAMLHSSTGRRPTRSDSRPQIGMNRNCMTE